MGDAIVVVRDLRKSYGPLRVLNGLNLTIHRGEIFALLGRNGAGKTTLIGCLTGLAKKDAGRVQVLGHDIDRDPYSPRYRVGLVPQEVVFDPVFTLRQCLANQMGYLGLKPDAARIRTMLDVFQLTGKADQTAARLSGGMRRRLLAAKALVHRPDLVFLDEPTAGVDLEQRKELWRYIRQIRSEGTTVVLTTHYLEEVEQLADRVGILNDGVLGHVYPTETLLKQGGHRLRVRFREPPLDLPRVLDAPSVDIAADSSEINYVEQQGGLEATELARRLYVAGASVEQIEIRRTPFEEVVVQLLHSAGSESAPVSAEPLQVPTPVPTSAMNIRGFWTLLRKEVWRFARLPFGSIIAPLISVFLYLAVFGNVGTRLGPSFRGHPYLDFVLPGLFVLQLASSAFFNTSTSLFEAKTRGGIVDVLVAPLRPGELVGAWVLSSLARGVAVAGLFLIGSAWMMRTRSIQWPPFVLLSILVGISFGALGLFVGLLSAKPEQITRVNALVLFPMTWFAGVYFAVENLPKPWNKIALANPALYLVEGMRAALLGESVPLSAYAVGAGMSSVLCAVCYMVVKSGHSLRN